MSFSTDPPLLSEFIAHINRQRLFPTTEKVLVAVSGGVDSSVLAHLMHRAGFPFAIAHCNFHLRPGDCDRDEAFVHSLAATYGVSFHVAGFDTLRESRISGKSIEETARELRYRWFEQLRVEYGYAAILVAHHADDVAETFFINLLRGTGLSGLHGILPVNGHVVRPLLPFSRSEIAAYAVRHSLEHVEDTTNASLLYLRNRVRNQLIPLLREINPQADASIARTIANLQSVEQLYTHLLAPILHRYIVAKDDGSTLLLLDSILSDYPAQLYPQMLYEALHPFGFNATQVASILAARPGACFRSSTHEAVCTHGPRIVITPADHAATDSMPDLHIEEHPISDLPSDFKQRGSDTLFLDADTLRRPLSLRHWLPSDYFQPLGMSGRRQLVSDYFSDHHFSLVDKQRQLILVDADHTILWIVGRRTTHPHRITHTTTRFLMVTVG